MEEIILKTKRYEMYLPIVQIKWYKFQLEFKPFIIVNQYNITYIKYINNYCEQRKH